MKHATVAAAAPNRACSVHTQYQYTTESVSCANLRRDTGRSATLRNLVITQLYPFRCVRRVIACSIKHCLQAASSRHRVAATTML
jgi:hypothetical protein